MIAEDRAGRIHRAAHGAFNAGRTRHLGAAFIAETRSISIGNAAVRTINHIKSESLAAAI